ncbi:hypothetical protein [Amycolatopsis sp. cmx-8-4]|uniref:hypothetical protein n=1 Tax=Amycolatopsis sp. cmx-8-4 TaxID=2790947 RepID=UPI00397CF72F
MTQPSQQVNPWLTGVDFAIQDPVQRAYALADRTYSDYGSAVTGGAGYSLSPDEAHNMLKQAQNALTELQKLRDNATSLQKVQPPAQDPASVSYNAKLANGSGVFDAGLSHINTEIAYLNELIIKIKEAFKKITGHEPTAADEINRAGQKPGGPTPAAPKEGTYS